jgi:hypothetical protein
MWQVVLQNELRLFRRERGLYVLVVVIPAIMAVTVAPALRPVAGNAGSASVAIAALFALFAARIGAQALYREQWWGTWARMVVSARGETKISTLAWAKAVPYGLLGLVQIGVMVAAAAVVGDLPHGSAFQQLVIISTWAVFMSGFAIFLAGATSSGSQLSLLGNLAVLVPALIGGAIVPFHGLPPLVQLAGPISPHYWLLSGLQLSGSASVSHGGHWWITPIVLGGMGVLLPSTVFRRMGLANRWLPEL